MERRGTRVYGMHGVASLDARVGGHAGATHPASTTRRRAAGRAIQVGTFSRHRVERRSLSVKSEAALKPGRCCAATIASLSLEQGSP